MKEIALTTILGLIKSRIKQHNNGLVVHAHGHGCWNTLFIPLTWLSRFVNK